MPWAALVQNFGRNALAVIPNSQPERAFSVLDFSFHMARMSMLESVAQSLAANAVDLVSDNGITDSDVAGGREINAAAFSTPSGALQETWDEMPCADSTPTMST